MWRAVGGPVTTSEQGNNCDNQEETGAGGGGQCGLWMEHCIRHPLSLLSDNIKCDNEQ